MMPELEEDTPAGVSNSEDPENSLAIPSAEFARGPVEQKGQGLERPMSDKIELIAIQYGIADIENRDRVRAIGHRRVRSDRLNCQIPELQAGRGQVDRIHARHEVNDQV